MAAIATVPVGGELLRRILCRLESAPATAQAIEEVAEPPASRIECKRANAGP